jgi:subtilisin family serine protease
MRSRPITWIVLCLLLAAGAWLFWPHAKRVVVGKFTPPVAGAFHSASTMPQIFPLKTASANSDKTVAAAAETNRFAYRLNNTAKSIGELEKDSHAILLENALIDTRAKLDFSIPKNLQAQGDPGAYIVQANGTISAAFRALLAAAGAQIVSYIPNNAYLVRISAGGASSLAANPLAQSVIPYEPYYKVQPPLIAFDQKPLPPGAVLNLGLFADNPAATIKQIEKLGGTILSQESEPFGLEVRVQPPSDWTALAQLSGVQIVEENHTRKLANDLSRVTTGVATNTVTGTNYLGLNGLNVVVAVDDSGVDATHPDFSATGTAASGPSGATRVIGDAPGSLVDTDGHGTFLAGEIAGNGSESLTVTNIPQGSVSNADFRGKAPMATLYSVGGINGADTNVISDRYFQESAALTNALIANESWGYGGDNFYDLAAASYDAAVRDALMGVTGSQPVLFVFAAGNDGHIGKDGGNGNDDGGGGTPDSISSPATAKDVLTVSALEQLRNITNTYTPLDSTNPIAAWKAATDSSSQVADYSSRGNVGIGTEGTFGRFKPDVVAPGTFVISTRSGQWDQAAYYNPTNVYVNDATFQLVDTNSLNYYNFPFVVGNNAVSVSIQVQANSLSPVPFPPDMPIYVSLTDYPPPSDFMTANDGVTIPTDVGAGYLQSIINNLGGFNFAVGNSTASPVNYDLVAEMVTTNDLGNYYTVLSNLNETLKPYYRYESGTSMAAADVSGVLALMQDYFTNTLHLTPSPVLLKAMLINGARPTGFYNLQVNNNINLEGWGLVNLPNSIPAGITNTAATATNSFFFVDQSPTNELATGDSRTYTISLSPGATAVPLRLTLAWTDPPGNPAAAIKLVNNLDLIVTNMDNTNVYYGNDIGPNQVFNTQESSTNPAPNLDDINNVENVFLPANAGTNFTVVIRATAVNVNAVTSNSNNIVQDFAFVVSSGNGSNTNGFSITASSPGSNPTGGQRITVITATNASPLMNQFVGASSPLVGTNIVQFTNVLQLGTNSSGQVTLGQTNQWHFYIWTNYCGQYAAFVTFLPPTAAIPRAEVFANSEANSTRSEADIDVFVTTDPSLTNLNPVAIANCITNPQVGASSPGGVNGTFYGAALDRGGS